MGDQKTPEASPPRPCDETSTLARDLRCNLPAGHTGRHKGNIGTAVVQWGWERWHVALPQTAPCSRLAEMELASEMDRPIARCAPELQGGLDEEKRARLLSALERALDTAAPAELWQPHPEDFERSSLPKLKTSPSA